MTILASVNNKTVMPGITPIADVPDTPTIGTATAAGLAASITFTAATTGGTPTTYTATSNPGSLTGTASSSPVTVSGLTEGTSYTFTVTAGNSTGTSPATSASNSITAVSPLSGGYDSLATVTVGATAVSSITFAGIPSGYKHLQIRATTRNNRNDDGSQSMTISLNGDTTHTNYRSHLLYGGGTSATTETAQLSGYYGSIGFTPAANFLANAFSGQVVDILDYNNTSKYKTVRTLWGTNSNGGSEYVGLSSFLWINTSAVTSLNISSFPSASFVQYSSFALYGVK